MAEFKTGDETVDERALRQADHLQGEVDANPSVAVSLNDDDPDETSEWLAGAILLGRGYAVKQWGGLLYAAKTKEILAALTASGTDE